MHAAKICPKCGNQLERGSLQSYGDVRVLKGGDLRGDIVVPFQCRFCGYIELYNSKYTIGY